MSITVLDMNDSITRKQGRSIDPAVVRQQLLAGDSWLLARMGAKDWKASQHYTFWSVRPKQNLRLQLVVGLAADDTYTVELLRVRKYQLELVYQLEGVYCDMLTEAVGRAFSKFSE